MRKVLGVVALIFVCLTYMSAQRTRTGGQLVPSGKGYAVPASKPVHTAGPNEVNPNTVHTGNGIDYHGGPVLPNTVNVYYIWYGNWGHKTGSDSAKTRNLLKLWAQSIGGTPYQNISTTYGDNSNNVSGNIAFGKALSVGYPYGHSINANSVVPTLVQKEILNGKLPKDSNALYFVLTSSDVADTGGFCSYYCGWHGSGTLAGADIKFSYVGNPDRCSSSCEAQTNSPNHDSGADGMANVMAHELHETVSDPEVGSGNYAWYQNASGGENGDLCAWNFGALLGGTIGNGGYNETFGGKNWLLQTIWENESGGGCPNYLGGPFH